MSPTLFWYVFRDLMRIFLLTSAALAGIMSFAGLLRPLTKHGLDGQQVVAMLGYFWPAMTTYSLPVAALFATTMVYGRLAADNELTACRAAGISQWVIALPAMVLGLCVTIFSLALLAFIVPQALLQVERVIYSNLAQLVANRIEQTHTFSFEQGSERVTVWAQRARTLDPPPGSDDQLVRLEQVLIATYHRPGRADRNVEIPGDFFTARAAVASISPARGEEPVLLRVRLEGGAKFPRSVAEGGFEAAIAATDFGPWPMPSPVRENTKFMDILRLREVIVRPEDSRRVARLLSDFIRVEARQHYLRGLLTLLEESTPTLEFGGEGQRYRLTRGDSQLSPKIVGDRLILPGGEDRTVRFEQVAPGGILAYAGEAQIRAWVDFDTDRLTTTVTLRNAVISDRGQPVPRGDGFERTFTTTIPPELLSFRDRTADAYVADESIGTRDQRSRLLREKLRVYNSAVSEVHMRLSFSLSCLVLVIVGCCLGMMFRSGNFLSAFAVSVVPAGLCILLIVSGQHTAENVPWDIGPDYVSKLRPGLALIWSGNTAVAVLASVLMWHLSRK